MGNQGMTNWKLIALFAVSLMLIAGLFSNAAMAQAGAGTAVVNNDLDASSTGSIPGGAKNHQISFTYTLPTTNRDNMTQGAVQIELPSGWSVVGAAGLSLPEVDAEGATARFVGSTKVVVTLPTDPDTDRTNDDLPATVTISFGVNAPKVRGSHDIKISSKIRTGSYKALSSSPIKVRVGAKDSITVASDETGTTGKAFADDEVALTFTYVADSAAATTVQITFPSSWTIPSDFSQTDVTRSGQVLEFASTTTLSAITVTTPKVAGKYEFTTMSKAEGGEFTKLDDLTPDDDVPAQPSIVVGNVVSGKGTVAIDPVNPVVGDTGVVFTITYTAAGRMVTDKEGQAGIRITFPFALEDNSQIASVTGGGAKLVADADGTDDANIDITISRLNEGGKVVLKTKMLDIPSTLTLPITAPPINPSDAEAADRKSSFGAVARTSLTPIPTNGSDRTALAFDAGNLSNADSGDAKAQITGGLLQPAEGSGTLKAEPAVVEKGQKQVPIKLTYTATRNDPGDSITITLPSGVANIKKATSGTSGVTPDHADGGTTITWPVSNLIRTKTLIANVKMDIPDSTDDLVFSFSTIRGGTTTPAPDSSQAKITVVGKAEDFEFAIVDLSTGNPIDGMFNAASKQEIGFRITAANSTIQENGYIEITVPALWSGVTTANRVAQVKISDLTEKTIRDALPKRALSTPNSRTIKVAIDDSTTTYSLAKGSSITVQYGVKVDDAKDYRALMPHQAGKMPITAKAKAYKSYNAHTLDSIEATITNVMDGSGEAMIKPSTVRAGTDDNRIEVKFTAQGSMGGGAVRLTIPSGWGEMQNTNAADFNHVAVRSPVKDVTLNADAFVDGVAIVNLPGDADNPNAFRKGNYFTLIYGGAPGNKGAEAQDTIGVASFTIESAGNSDGNFAKLTSTDAAPSSNPKGLGEIFKGADGALKIDVKSGADGSGTAEVEIAGTSAGKMRYGGGDEKYEVHAADDVYLKFTYTASQAIKMGQLILTIPTADGWTMPQNLSTGRMGYTRVDAPSGAVELPVIGDSTVTVDIIDLAPDEEIMIHYGSMGSGMVMAPRDTGPSQFYIAIKGTEEGSPITLDDPLVINVRSQASGAGTAMIDVTAVNGDATLYAGDMDRELRVVYTAAGQMRGGDVKLTIPKVWSDPEGTVDTGHNLEVTPAGAHEEVVFGADTDGNHTVVAKDVDLAADGALTFVYSNVVVPSAESTVVQYQFEVAVFGGEQPFDGEDGTMEIADMTDLVVEVQEAKAGSGMVMVDPTAVNAEGDEVTLTFTYTAAGDIFYPRGLMVEVPTSWDEPTSGSNASDGGRYEVKHMRGTTDEGGVIERPPEGRKMVARVKQGSSVKAGDKIMFVYHADPPVSPGISMFKVYFDGEMVEGSPVEVLVQPAGGATQIALGDVAALSADEDPQMPVMVTVMLQAADGTTAAYASDLMFTLSSNSSTGMFALPPADGSMPEADAYMAEVDVSIGMGMWEGMAYYMDSTLGTHMITAMLAEDVTVAAATDFADAAMADVKVATDVVDIASASFEITDMKTAAMDGDTITVTAMATRDREDATFTIGTTIVPMNGGGISMDETPPAAGETLSTYMGTHTLPDGSPEGSHAVTVHIGDEMESAGNLMVDNTDPVVSNVSVSPAMVADGGTVTISATVTDPATVTDSGSGVKSDSVMADVSMLDSTQTMVTLTMGTNGSYSVDVDISMDNERGNGDKTITVTAMDNAGNSSDDTSADAQATVELRNAMSFTSMISSGVSLFHVPLNDPNFGTIGQLRAAIGDEKVNSIVAYDTAGRLEPSSDNIAIEGGRGIIISLSDAAEVKFTGEAWGADGTATVSLEAGDANLIGLPLMSDDVSMVSDILDLHAAIEGVYPNLTDFVAAAGDTGDGPVAGDAAYYVVASRDADVTVEGSGWTNNPGASSAPIALSAYKVDHQTPVLSVFGSVVDEITGVAKEGFRVKVKNLTTKAAVSEITSVETEDGYSVTLLDLVNAHAARVGDVLEISADSPNPLIGVEAVRYTVTVDDVKNSTIQLENLVAYEIPAETALLRNYPNPFNPETWIPYHLSEDADVRLTIYNINGEVVRDIDVGHQTAAKYDTRSKAIYWDGRNRFGEQVASGIYFYSLSAGDFSATRKMVILK